MSHLTAAEREVPRRDVDRVARLLMAAWERAEAEPVGISYVATFADMARAVLADERTRTDPATRDLLERAQILVDLPPPSHRQHLPDDAAEAWWVQGYDACRRRLRELVRRAAPDAGRPQCGDPTCDEYHP